MDSTPESGGWWLYMIALLFRESPNWVLRSSRCVDEAILHSSHFISACFVVLVFFIVASAGRWALPGGPAWGNFHGASTIPGPRGWPIIGSLLCMRNLAHRRLAESASRFNARRLMSLSLGDTRVVISSDPVTARVILNSACFADRPLKFSAELLEFDRAIGFAPYGAYWRNLRKIAATHLFSPRRIAAQEAFRQLETSLMLQAIRTDADSHGVVHLRKHLQLASLNNIVRLLFGRRFNGGSEEANVLQSMVQEGYELLGSFNWADHLSILQCVDPLGFKLRCESLVVRVTNFVQQILDERRNGADRFEKESDFVSVLLSLNDEDKLKDSDMISVLWEMVFRGTDTSAILGEWVLAEVILHPRIQRKLQAELDTVVGSSRACSELDIPRLPYLQAVVKETLRMHPPGPLLSWARLAIHDTVLDGHFIPAGTSAMVNMWSITHDPSIWADPDVFKPERFHPEEGGIDIDIRGNDLRLAPFGAGRRVCPGRTLGLVTVHLWVARLLHHFEWVKVPSHPVLLKEILKLSCELQTPLVARPVQRIPDSF